LLAPIIDPLRFKDGTKIDLFEYNVMLETDSVSVDYIQIQNFRFCDYPKYGDGGLEEMQYDPLWRGGESFLSSIVGYQILKISYKFEISFANKENRYLVLVYLQGYYKCKVDYEVFIRGCRYFCHVFFLDGLLFLYISVCSFEELLFQKKIHSADCSSVVDEFFDQQDGEFIPMKHSSIYTEKWNYNENNHNSPVIHILCSERRKKRVLSLLRFDDRQKFISLGFSYLYVGYDYHFDCPLRAQVFSVHPYNLHKRLLVDKYEYTYRTNIAFNFCASHYSYQCPCNSVVEPERPLPRNSCPYRSDIQYLMFIGSVDQDVPAYHFFKGRGVFSRYFKAFNRGIFEMKRRSIKFVIRGGYENEIIELKII